MFGKLISTAAATLAAVAVASPATPPTIDWKLDATALMMRGLNADQLTDGIMSAVLAGRFASDTKASVPWPGELWPYSGQDTLTMGASAAIGTENFYNAITSTPGPVVSVGMSGSALVIDEVMLRLEAAGSPRSNELSFVVIGDANRGMFSGLRGVSLPILDYTVPALPVTPYDVTVVAAEYDGYSDFPDRWWNLLADANALAGTGLFPGFGSVHFDSGWYDLSTVPAANISVSINAEGGKTTTYLIPTPDLPLLRPLSAMGVSQHDIDALTAILRPLVDLGYSRNDPPSKGQLRPRAEQASAPAGTSATAATGPTAEDSAVPNARDSGSANSARPKARKAASRERAIRSTPSTGHTRSAGTASSRRVAG
ncbi:PE-PPE domain-containing protein [Mycolicibacterium sp. CH28]|uniref:PE-PPE domain-containing protein n=1 Tax=Mycolicibacterium sp. CH28 TaxID=2512237 RepID=UPI001080950E|nr:PE-PPE domain-containing protein [Mycolicibacterium sp. CH28]TGD88218.1 PE-PPE domain-containing protein [Mycolicibacterium sp. CH28]